MGTAVPFRRACIPCSDEATASEAPTVPAVRGLASLMAATPSWRLYSVWDLPDTLKLRLKNSELQHVSQQTDETDVQSGAQ